MPRNALIDETKSGQITVTFPFRGNVRLAPTVEALLEEARPANLGKGDQITQGALQIAFIAAILRWDLEWLHSALGRLLGKDRASGGPSPVRGTGA